MNTVEVHPKTSGDTSKRRPWSVVYVALVMALLLVPAVTVPFAPTDPEAELQELAPAPELINTDGHPNVGVLADAGEWFDDHFGFRQAAITADARIQADVLATSPTASVIVGQDGYLYYGGTLGDYARTSVMTEAAADNAAFNLSLMEAATRARGAEFLLAVAPNKNTLYPAYMPGYDLAGEGPSSWDVVREKLDAYGVTYVDLFDVLESQPDVLYMKTDTHWNTQGALVAYNAMMEELGQAHVTYESSPRRWDETFVGDLEAMLYPLGRTPEPLEVVEEAEHYRYVNEATSVEDAEIATESTAPSRSGSLVMYRDSFGNALLPLFATQYERAYFTKLVPYYLQAVETHEADTVIVERAERHLSFFATTPPLMAAPRRSGWTLQGEAPTDSTLTWSDNGPYTTFEGVVDPAYRDEGTRIFVVVTGETGAATWYEAFHQSLEETADESPDEQGAVTLDEVEASVAAEAHPAWEDSGFYLLIPRTALPDGAKLTLAVGRDGHATAVAQATLAPAE